MIVIDSIVYLMKGVDILGLENLPDIVTVKQLADFMQISDQTVIRAIKSKELQAFKIGREWRIEKEEVLKWTKK